MRMEVVITTVTIQWAHIIAHVTLAMCYWMMKEIVQVCRQLFFLSYHRHCAAFTEFRSLHVLLIAQWS